MNIEQKKLLENFFGAYFHQDWDLEWSTIEEAVELYRKDVENDMQCIAVSEAIREYVAIFLDDDKLLEDLYKGLGCYYLPTADGMTAKEWLHRISSLLIRD